MQKIEKDYYTKDFYNSLRGSVQQSAEEIIPLVLKLIPCNSVIDVGCGDGTWLKVFQKHGVEEILGVDGSYVDETTLVISKESFLPFDLKKSLRLEKTFDIAMSLEVAEHLPAKCAESFIDSLVSLSSVILFSAAIPYQGGDNHINEQWQEYWAQEFKKRGYVAIDYIRKKVWDNQKVAYWYSQNTLLFIQQCYLNDNPFVHEKLKIYDVEDSSLLSVVHPTFYLIKLGIMTWEEYLLKLGLKPKESLINLEANKLSNKVINRFNISYLVKKIVNVFKQIISFS